jgi:hypothetical protein
MSKRERFDSISRREFLRAAGLALGSVALVFLSACRNVDQTITATVTETLTHKATSLVTTTATKTRTTTATSAITMVTTPAQTPAPITTSSNSPAALPLSSRDFAGTIVLGRPENNSVTLSLLTGSDSELYCRYGRAPGKYDRQTEVQHLAKDQPLELELSGLDIATPYYYQLCHRAAGQGNYTAAAECSFHTQRTPGQAFVFTVDADPHWDQNADPEEIRAAFLNIMGERPDFNLDLGDTFMTEKLTNPDYGRVAAVYTDRRSYFGLFGASVPLFLVNGNHDGELGWLRDGTANNEAVWATTARHLYYPNPAPDSFYSGDSRQEPFVGLRRSYYAWTWGDALFVVLDPYWDAPAGKENADMWNMTLGTTQYNWLKGTLATSQAKYKFVFTHHVLGNCRGGAEWCDYYEWGGRSKNGVWEFEKMRPGWEMPVHQLFVKTNVTIVFQGHDHLYVKQERDGIIYQEVPQPSVAKGGSGAVNDGSYKSGVIMASPGHLRVSVSSAKTVVDYIHSALPSDQDRYANGGVVYSYSVP